MTCPRRIQSIIAAVFALSFLTPLVPTAAAQSSFAAFKAEDYTDVTARKKLPAPVKGNALAAVRRYIEAQRPLDISKTEIVVLQDTPNKRVYRYVIVCKSKEECGDDSVAESREAVEIIRRNGQWQVVWVGLQVRCHPGRGHPDWSKTFCS